MIQFGKISVLAFAALSILSLGACGAKNALKEEVADRVAHPAWMVQRAVAAGPFVLTAYERMHERGEIATLYIEGDDEAFPKPFSDTKFYDPTPQNPVALHLAAMDKSENLAYLARPCQYTKLRNPELNCEEIYWADAQAKYGSTVISAYNEALDGIKRRYGVTAFHIVGYDSGATIAALLAGQRKDVLSLRTVAGIFDMDALSTSTANLRAMPQHHFIGGQDEVVSPFELHTYLNALGDTPCAAYTTVPLAEHRKGWGNDWPELLKKNVPSCYIPSEPTFIPITKPEPIYVPRMGGAKK